MMSSGVESESQVNLILRFFFFLCILIHSLVSDVDNGPCLGWRVDPTKPYQWMSYKESLLRAQNFGSGLVALGLHPGPGTLVGIYSQNCPEWILGEYALYTYSMAIVPLYDTLGPDSCRFIINQSKT